MRDEARVLLQKAQESLDAARLLNSGGFPGFAASRAYYAMFYAAEALLLDRGLSFSSHSAVIAFFGKEFAKSGLMDVKFHRYLIDAQDLRNVGDYGIGPPVSPKQAREILAWAEEFIAAAKKLILPS
jgi:uncharacterized protein (UPF0332 family)